MLNIVVAYVYNDQEATLELLAVDRTDAEARLTALTDAKLIGEMAGVQFGRGRHLRHGTGDSPIFMATYFYKGNDLPIQFEAADHSNAKARIAAFKTATLKEEVSPSDPVSRLYLQQSQDRYSKFPTHLLKRHDQPQP